MLSTLGAAFKFLRIFCAVGLIFISLWALLLPPLFPYSTHAIVNAKAVTIRTRDEGQVSNLPETRAALLKAGDRVATVKRDLVKIQRDLEKRQFTQLKLKEEIESLGKAIDSRKKKLQETQAEVATERLSAIREMELMYKGAAEKVRIYMEEAAEKRAGQKRVAPLFSDGIVTAAQWSETRQQTIEAEKNLSMAESERALCEVRLERMRASKEVPGKGFNEAALKRCDTLEQQISNLQIQRIELSAELGSVENQIALVKSYENSDLSYDLTTPIDGMIWRHHVVNGENLGSAESVVEMADTHSLFIEAHLNRNFINSIAIGDKATVYLLAQSRFIEGRVTDIQVQERTVQNANIINTLETDATVLRVNIAVEPGTLKPGNIGQLAKVVLSSGKLGRLEGGLIWLSLLLQSHK